MLPFPLKNLIDRLSKLPGFGQRSAARLAFWLFNQPQNELTDLANAVARIKIETKTCPRCFNLTTQNNLCAICSDKKRRQNLICAVEDIFDILPLERTRQFSGVYHVLGGLISPPDGLTPDRLRVKELISRVKKLAADKTAGQPEIILAFNPTVEGDVTALYLERLLKPLNIKITKLNRGLATGSDLEYADETTLINALKFRH